MQKYKVKSLAVSGLGNKVHRCRAIVTESNFPKGRAEELVASGHLEKLAPEAEEVKQINPPTPDDFSKLNKNQLKAKLKEKGIEFDASANKEVLLALLTAPEAEEEEKDETGSGSVDALKDSLDQ